MGSSTGRFDVSTEWLVVSPIWGRTDDLNVIGAVTAVGQGRGGVLVIEGPPDIGKSRLLTEVIYTASAPGWPGDAPTVPETRANPAAMNDVGIAQTVDHYARLIGSPTTRPIVIGHSLGGLIAQELLASNLAAAAVAIDPAPIKGVKVLPLKVTKEVVATYSHGPAQNDFHIFEGHGHSLTIDNKWKEVTDVALQRLATNGL